MTPPRQGNPSRRFSPAALALGGALALPAGCASPRPPPPATPIPWTYATLFGFREAPLRQGPGATEPFAKNGFIDPTPFNAHLARAPGVRLAPPASAASAAAVASAASGPPAPLASGAPAPASRPRLLVLLPRAASPAPGDALLGLAEGVVDGLRAAGVDARRDGVISGAALVEPRLAGALLLGSEVTTHDAIEARFWLEDPAGARLRELRCQARPAPAPGAALAACLLADPAFARAVGAAP